MADILTTDPTATPAGQNGSTGSGGVDWASALGSLANVGFGLNTLFGNNAQSPQGIYQQAAAAADPFASQRGQYQTQLSRLMSDPSSFNLSPAAKAQMQMGTENLTRSAAAQGFLGSGNILGELQKYGQNVASQDYFNQANLLSGLAGAQSGSPATAGAILGDLYGARQLGQSQLGTGINALSKSGLGGLLSSGLSALLGGGSSGSSGGLLGQLIGGGGNLLSSLFGGSSTGSGGIDWASILSGGSGSSTMDQIGSSLSGGTGLSNTDVLNQLFSGTGGLPSGSADTSGTGLSFLQPDSGLSNYLDQSTYANTGDISSSLGFF